VGDALWSVVRFAGAYGLLVDFVKGKFLRENS
jgi:hypothetical protein